MRFFLTCGFIALGALPASAGNVSLVVPNRSDVPIIINGVDASWAVIEGDWGLARGIHVQPTIYGGRLVDPEPHVGHYFPSNGEAPGYGRLEIEPPTRRSRRTESYFRSYSAESAPPRVPEASPPLQMMIEAPLNGAQTSTAPTPRRRRN